MQAYESTVVFQRLEYRNETSFANSVLTKVQMNDVEVRNLQHLSNGFCSLVSYVILSQENLTDGFL